MDATLQVLMRETPLEVLTRAASLVAGCEPVVADTGRKPQKRSVSSEYDLHPNVMTPTLPEKSRRLLKQESSGQTPVMLEDESKSDDDGGRRSAATQTSFSSFVPPFSGFYQLQQTDEVRESNTDEEPHLILDLDQHTVKPSHSYHSPPTGIRTATHMTEYENNNYGPINLTVSISSRCMTGPYPQRVSYSWPHMPSGSHSVNHFVSRSKSNCDIGQLPNWRSDKNRLFFNGSKTEAASLQKNSSMYHESGTGGFMNGTSPRKTGQLKSNPCSYPTVATDPIIDEHFRRSLGTIYSRVVTRDLQTSTPGGGSLVSDGSPQNHNVFSSVPGNNNLPPCTANKTVTGAVDEHFAKSLGSTWTKIKTESAKSRPGGNSSAVDDHFAKALGDTWFKLKADKRST